jgi:hypothetical protein
MRSQSEGHHREPVAVALQLRETYIRSLEGTMSAEFPPPTPQFFSTSDQDWLAIADKRIRYPEGRSRIVYIGTTKRGARRVAQSIASRADKILTMRGVRSFHARMVTCRPRRNVKTWFLLKRALLVAFRERYGAVPKTATATEKGWGGESCSPTSVNATWQASLRSYHDAV